MRKLILGSILALTLFATGAAAETIANRFGLTGRVGFAMPVKPGFMDDEFINGTSDTKNGAAWNGGFIYGFNDNIASELEVSYIPRLDVKQGSAKAYEAKIKDISLGLQYRFMPQNHLVPYVGAGLDFMDGRLKKVGGGNYDMDWTYGGHINAGVDWFLTKGIALSADLRGTFAKSGDISNGNEYDPAWFQGSFGLRLFLPEKW